MTSINAVSALSPFLVLLMILAVILAVFMVACALLVIFNGASAWIDRRFEVLFEDMG